MDTHSIIFYLPTTIFAILSLVFYFLWRAGLSSSWHWVAGFLQTGSGFALSSFPIEPTFDQLVSGPLYIGAAYAYGSAILRHFEQPLYRIPRRVLALSFLPPHLYLVLVNPTLRWDLFLIEMVFACLFGLALFCVIRKAKGAADIAFLVSSSLVVIDCISRGVIFTFFLQTSDDMGDFLYSAYNLSVHVSTITLCLLFPFSAIAAMTTAAINRHRNASEQDPMTGLLNRRGFEQTARGHGRKASSAAVIICDIDHFKKINDSFGHATGDRVIIEFSRELAKFQTQKIHIARFGGEEFVLLVEDAYEKDAAQLADLLRERLASRPWDDIGLDQQVTASFGIAQIDRDGSSIDVAIERADKALYLAKLNGRNRIALASQIDENLFRSLRQVQDLKTLPMRAKG